MTVAAFENHVLRFLRHDTLLLPSPPSLQVLFPKELVLPIIFPTHSSLTLLTVFITSYFFPVHSSITLLMMP
jgi:hypothetical protein